MAEGQTTERKRSSLASDMTILAIVGIVLLAALGAGGLTVYQQFYSPSAFVMRYLDLLSSGRAADALRVPGVMVDRETLDAAGISDAASEAMLRRSALAPLTDIEIVSEQTTDAGTTVTVEYSAAGHAGSTKFMVAQDGWAGVTPNWRFTSSPLAVIDLVVRGADKFSVNGFEVDRRQVSAAGADAQSLDPLPLLVFTPGLYSITVDTPTASATNIGVLADKPLASTPLDVQTTPTAQFLEVVQTRVEEFLTECATQQVLQPTACPFGLRVDNRIESPPIWSIALFPEVEVTPDGGQWQIPAADALAHVEVEVKSLFDGSVELVSEDVPFQVNGTIVLLPDGSASIRIGSPGDGG